MDSVVPEIDRVELPTRPITTLPIAIDRLSSDDSVAVERAERARNLLSESRLFPAVGWTSDFPDQRVIVVRATQGPRCEGCDDEDNLLWFVTDTIWPTYAKWNRGLFLTRTDRGPLEFRCDWQGRSVKSLFLAPAALVFFQWHMQADPQPDVYSLRRCLIEQAAVFADAGPPG